MPDDEKPNIPYGQSRGLTPGEIELAKSVYGNSVDYSKVRINHKHYMLGQPNETAMSPDGNMYYPTEIYKNDFSKDSRQLFIHEMAHIWQKQNNITDPVMEGISLFFGNLGNYNASYSHTVDPRKDLLDYNMEQQGRLIESYFEYKERTAKGPPKFEPIDYDKLESSGMTKTYLQMLETMRRLDPDNKMVKNAASNDGFFAPVFFDMDGHAHYVRKPVEEQRRDWAEDQRTQAADDKKLLAIMRNFAADPGYMNKCPIVALPTEDSRVIPQGPKTTGMG